MADSKGSGNKELAPSEAKSIEDSLDLDKNKILYRHSDNSLKPEAHDKDYMEMVYRGGKHSDLVKRILRQKIESRAQEFPRWPGDNTGGVKLMMIESRFCYDRARLTPDFDDDWRKYRARYLHSLHLDPREPVQNTNYELSTINPIRRVLQKPGDWIEANIIKRFIHPDDYYSHSYRQTGKILFMSYLVVMGCYYWVRYNQKTWEGTWGPAVHTTAPIIYPSHPDYPFKDYRTLPTHFYDQQFSRRKIFKDLRDWEDRSTMQ